MGTCGERGAVSKRRWESRSDFQGRGSFHSRGRLVGISLPGAFELSWCRVIERGVEPLPVVVHLDVLEQLRPRCCTGDEAVAELLLESGENDSIGAESQQSPLPDMLILKPCSLSLSR